MRSVEERHRGEGTTGGTRQRWPFLRARWGDPRQGAACQAPKAARQAPEAASQAWRGASYGPGGRIDRRVVAREGGCTGGR